MKNRLNSDNPEKYYIQSVDNALHLLEALCDSGQEVNISELSKRLGLRKSTVFRLLMTFQRRGYVEKEGTTHGYRLGLTAFEIGHKCISHITLQDIARSAMENLALETRESIYLAVRRDQEICLLGLAEKPQQVRVTSLVGSRIPLAGTAAGQVFAVFEKGSRGVEMQVPHAADVIRQMGFARMKNDITDGVVSLAAPLLDYQNRVPGALLLVAPEFRLNSEKTCAKLARQLLTAADSISAALGHLKPREFARGA